MSSGGNIFIKVTVNENELATITVNVESPNDVVKNNGVAYISIPLILLLLFILLIVLAVIIIIIIYLKKRNDKIEAAKPPDFAKLIYKFQTDIPAKDTPSSGVLTNLEKLLIGCEDFDLITTIISKLDKRELDDGCRSMVFIFETHNRALELVKHFILEEIKLQSKFILFSFSKLN